VLWLLMLLAQHQALLHRLEHVFDAVHAGSQDAPADLHCIGCDAVAGLDGAVPLPEGPQPPRPCASSDVSQVPAQAPTPGPVRVAYLSRAPPTAHA
jgi:hypothetical protein